MPTDAQQAAPALEVIDRRDQRKRQSGALVSINGSRAVVFSRMSQLYSGDEPFWAVGDLITIYGRSTRIVCLVQTMCADEKNWSPEADVYVRTDAELLGEIIDTESGPMFRRGIAHYPALGVQVSRIRQTDLVAIYDLGSRKSTPIGHLVQGHIPAAVDVDAMLRKHFAVVGTTGVGKSTSVSILLKAAIADRPKMRIVILDPHNEYSHAFKGVAATVAAAQFELPFWLFQFDEFIEAVYRGAAAPPDETEFLRDAVSQARDMFAGGGVATASVIKKTFRAGETSDQPRPYRINDVMAQIDAEVGRLEQRHSRAALRSLKGRIESISNDPAYRFMFGKAAIDAQPDFAARALFRLSETEQPITILQMAGIPSDVVNAAVSVLARLAFDQALASHGAHEFLLLCEEAHRYVPADAGMAFAPTRRAIARIAKEGRKYGCYLGIVTQRPGELDPTILSQCSTVFAMRLANAADQAIMRSAIPDNSAGVLEFISALSNREAIAFGEAVATPMRMVFATQSDDVVPRMATLDPVRSDVDAASPYARPAAPAAPTAPRAPIRAPDPPRVGFGAPAAPAGLASRAGSLTLDTADWPVERQPRGFARR